ncbi:MAG: prolipoprotein diacylglyceryl transferase family protein [Bacteroidota bacterium]
MMISFNWEFPWRVTLGYIEVSFHVVLEFLAFFIGFRYYLFLRKKQGDAIGSANRVWILIGAIFGALIGSRLVGGLESMEQLKLAPNKWLHFYGNKTVAGGFLGGLFGVEFMKKIIGEKTRSGDLFVYPIILALLIGRLGCLSMGVYEDVYGAPTSFFMGMDLGDGIRRHPLILYEMFFLILLWVAIKKAGENYPLANGSSFILFMIGYLLFRFCIEFLKTREQYLLGLGAIQLASLLGLVYYSTYILRPRRLLATIAAKS